MRHFLFLLLVFTFTYHCVHADTPPPNSIKAKTYDGTGSQAIGNVSDALKVNLSNASLAVTGTFWQATQPVSGTFWQATQPVSASALPLPTGASTSAKQPALGTAGTASADVLSVQGIASMTPLLIDGSATVQPVSGTFWQTTQPVSAASLPLPTGAATASKQPALGTAGTPSSDVISIQGITSMTPLKTDGSGVTQPVSQSGTWTLQAGGKAKANAPIRYDYSGGSVTTSAYTQLVASTTAAATQVCVFDSSGQDLVLAVGAAASEVDQMEIFPGGNGCEPLAIAGSSRISVKAKSATASSGVILVNLYQ